MQPANHHAVFDDKLTQTFGELDRRVYNAVLRNLPSLIDMRVADLACLAGVSNASVVRFCKKCGFSGFPEFKMATLERMQKRESREPLRPVVDELRSIVAPEMISQMTAAIADAFVLLREARNVLVFGAGRAGGIALYASHQLNQLGLPTMPITSFPTYTSSLGNKDLVAIVISHEASESMVYAALLDLVTRGSKTIAITPYPGGTIGRLVDVCIAYAESPDADINAAGMATMLPTLYAVEQLARLLYNDNLG